MQVSVSATASILPETVISNREITERLIAGIEVKDAADEEAVSAARARADLIERKTGLRARRFFDPDESPVAVGLDLLTRLLRDTGWEKLDGVIVTSSSAHGFPGLSQQIVAQARLEHETL